MLGPVPAKPLSPFTPTVFLQRLLGDWVPLVSRQTLRADATAGLLGMVLALPQGIAFAALAGLPVEMGLYTAIVSSVVAALAGSSWHLVSGPTNAISLALLAMLSPLAAAGSTAYVQLVLVLTLLVGLMQWLIGALRLGALANFISPTALFGFTAGAALLIALHALADVLGLDSQGVRGAGPLLAHLAGQWQAVQWPALGVALGTAAVAWGVRWRLPRWPHMLMGLAGGTGLALLWGVWSGAQGSEGATVLRTVGQIPTPWPSFGVPQVPWSQLPELLGLAFALTIVALGQTISMAKALAAQSGQRLDANREFMGQGLSNVVGSFFSCYVSCGSLNRSVPNWQAGARTPLAVVFSALCLLGLVGLVSSWLAHIPMAAIAALLLFVAWNLFDAPRWRELWRVGRRDFWIALATLAATVSLRLEVAIMLGTLLSLMAFLYRTAKPAMRTMGFDSHAPDRRFVVLGTEAAALPECPQLKLLRMEGEVYFGALQHVADHLHALRQAPGAPRHLLVMAKSMNFIDLAGADLWARELRLRRAMGGDLYFHRPRPEVLALWQRTGFDRALGADHIFPDKGSAIATIVDRLDADICATCHVRLFNECERRPHPAHNANPG